MADEWRTPSFRQTVITKIDEAIRQSGGQITKTATEMEAHFFQRANTKDDYLHYLAKLLLHIREMNKRAVPAGNQPGGPQQGAPQGQMMNQMNVRPMMQGDQQQQQQVQQQGQQPQQQMMNPMGMQQQPQQQMMNQFAVNQQNMNMGNPLMQQLGNAQGPGPAGPNSVLVNQLSQPGMPGMGQNMPQQQQQPQQQGQQPNMSLLAAQRQRFAAVAAAKMVAQQQQQQQQQPTPQQSAQQQQQLMNQQLLMQQQQQQQQQRKQMEGLQAQGPSTPQQFAPSPAPMSMPSMVASSVQSQISAPSPAFVPSPGNPQIASSPASAAGRTPVPPQQQQRGMMGNLLPPPSPSMTNVATPGGGGMLHTPQGAGMGGMQPQGGVGGPMGPMGPNQQVMNEDQLYLEKVRQLSRFIEPLTRLIARYGDEDSEKQSKMKIMLDILSNPSRRMPMDTLLKCEAVLEKMDFKRSETGSLAPPSVSSVPSLGVAVPGSSSKDPPPPTAQLHPLLETIANQAKSPFINHTLRRTFSAAVETLVGCDISPPPSICDSEDEMTEYDEMMDTLEREIANLDPRFRVSLNPHQLSGVSSLQLVCELNDKFLPKVPALQVIVPHDYPKSAPICPDEQKLFEASVFLRDVIEGLRCRISHLPARYSLGQVLHCWEMALRNACKPQSSDNVISQTSVLWGF